MSYDNWRKRLEIAEKYSTVADRRKAVAALGINFSQPTIDDEGYYRKPITEKLPNENRRIVGWIPVAYFLSDPSSADGIELCGVIGAGAEQRHMTDRELNDEELWSWVVSNPISYKVYEAVADNGEPWPDAPPAAPRVIERTDNLPPQVDPLMEHKEAIENAIGAAKGLKVATAEEAAIAAGAANIIRDRRLAVEKIAKTRVDPLLRAYEEERNKWSPLVKIAKDAEGVLRIAVNAFEVAERKRVAAEQLAALDRQREIDEANERAADRAIAAGTSEPLPVVEEVVIPKAPDRVKPTHGTYKPKAPEPKKFAVIENDIEVYKHFRENPAVKDLLERLATNAIRSGFAVPGTTTREE